MSVSVVDTTQRLMNQHTRAGIRDFRLHGARSGGRLASAIIQMDCLV